MKAAERSNFWICFWLFWIACALIHIDHDLDAIVRVIHEHAGEP